MANGLFDSGRERFLGGDLDWDADDIRQILGDAADDTPNLSTDDFLDDISAPSRVAVSGSLASKTKAAGVADAADGAWTSVTGDPSEWVTGYAHTGTDATSELIYFIDTATGLPVTPNGANINWVFDSGANRIFKL